MNVGHPAPARQSRPRQSPGGTELDSADYGRLLFKARLEELDRARSYDEIADVHKKLVNNAHLFAPVALEQLRYEQTPERLGILEDVVVHGLDPVEVLGRIAEPDVSRFEIGTLAMLLGRYVQEQAVSQSVAARLRDALVALLGHPDVVIALDAISALSRVADDFPVEVKRALTAIAASTTADELVRAEAQTAIDDID